MSAIQYWQGQSVELRVLFLDVAGVPLAAGGVAFRLKKPDASFLTIAAVEDPARANEWIGYVVADQAGVLAKVTGILAEADISIDAVLQREADEIDGASASQTDLIILTHDCQEARMDAALARMQALPTVLQNIVRIRKEELA